MQLYTYIFAIKNTAQPPNIQLITMNSKPHAECKTAKKNFPSNYETLIQSPISGKTASN